MKPILFSDVNNRKLNLQNSYKKEKISFKTVSNNLNAKNLLLFTESTYNDMDSHCKRAFLLYDRLLKESTVSDIDKRKIEHSLLSNIKKVRDIDSVYQTISSTNIDNKYLFFDSLEVLEHCDRVIRNEAKLSKRFDMQKLISENITHGDKHTIYELCSLLDTYSISSKAKMNIALENVIYALYRSGYGFVGEATEYIVEYFLTRDTVITDKQYDEYIDVLENNRFINKNLDAISYVFEAKNTEGNSFTNKAKKLIMQCETKQCASHMSQILKIKNEKQASNYIDKSIEMIINEDVTINDSLLLLKSIYCLPLIGNISKQFVNYKLEMSKKKIAIKKKLNDIENQKIIKDVLDDGDMIDYAKFVAESVYFENYILDDAYKDETDPIKLLESEVSSNDIKDIINAFKASNEKSPSKFKNMISRIMTKSPENIIDGTPNIFGAARIMIYLAISASFSLGPVFAAILALINKVLTMHLDLKQSEKLLKYLKQEKEKAEKRLNKLSGKEKDIQKEYIDCIKSCIKKVESFISNIDDENESINDYDDDFNFGDFNFENTILESGILYKNSVTKEISDLLADSNMEILAWISELFDNCNVFIANEFYDFVKNNISNNSAILENRGKNRIIQESSFIVEYEAMNTLKEILNEAKNNKKTGPAFNLNTLKMAVINFKKKFKNLKGKEQEIWRNIDIATNSLTRGIQKALTSDRREAIIKGSIIPSFSKIIKYAITVGSVGIFTGPVGAAISAVGMLGASKYLNEKERRLLYDEIDTELQVVEKQIQLAENDGDMNQYRFLLNYQKKLTREKHRIKYGVQMSGRPIPEIKRRND